MCLGRASASPAMDVFITLLSLGVNGYKNLISQRKEMYKYLKEELGKVATKHGERLLDTKNNPISIGKLSMFMYMDFFNQTWSSYSFLVVKSGNHSFATIILQCILFSMQFIENFSRGKHSYAFKTEVHCHISVKQWSPLSWKT